MRDEAAPPGAAFSFARRAEGVPMKSWDPFRDLLTIQDRMNKLFETVLTGPVPTGQDGEGVHFWRPVSEVFETAEALVVECEIAGLERDQIEIQVDEQLLTVQGERARPEDQEDWAFHRLERPRGKFVRKFELPLGLDLDRVSAQLDGGVLRVMLPKRPEARARAVPVARTPGRDN